MLCNRQFGVFSRCMTSAALVVCGVSYSLVLSLIDSPISDSIGTILFLFASTLIYVYLIWKSDFDLSWRNLDIALLALAVPVGFAIGASIAGQSESFFWVADSTSTHLPGAINIANWLTQGTPVAFGGPLQSRGLFTHFWVALFIAVLGTHAWVTVIALGVLKIPTCYLIARTAEDLFGSTKFRSAYVIYLIAPTVLWHTLALYKEASVHLFVALTIFGLVSMQRKVTAWKILSLALGIAGLAYERFYLVALFLPLFAYFVLTAFKARRLAGVVAFSTGAIGFYFVFPFFEGTISEAISRLRELRKAHSLFPDINYKLNYEIPYIVAVIKSFLTPIWTPSKIEVFRGPSALFTWGSFVHQFIIITYLLGVIRAVRAHGFLHFAIQVPFFLFILAIAYVSPWAGRIRDSFYPLIAVYSLFYLRVFLMDDLRKIRNLALVKKLVP